MIEAAKAVGQGCDKSLIKAKRFHVAIDICGVATGFSGSYVATG